MRAVLISDDLGIGGSERQILLQAAQLGKLGSHVILSITIPPPGSSYPRAAGSE
jgi:hypothetical protein